MGNPTPKFGYGGSLNVSFKQFDLGIEVNGVYGNQIYREWATSMQQNSLYNYPSYDMNAWHGAGYLQLDSHCGCAAFEQPRSIQLWN